MNRGKIKTFQTKILLNELKLIKILILIKKNRNKDIHKLRETKIICHLQTHPLMNS